MARVYALTPEQPRVREQAFTAALLAGDLNEAGRIAPTDPDVSPVIVQAGRLVQAVQAYAGGDARRANALLIAAPVGEPHDRAGFYVQAWIAAAAGTGTAPWPCRRLISTQSAIWWRGAIARACWSSAAATPRPTPNGAT
ncbi:hypothetical protein V8F63_01155 [Brevundimonas sp. LF-1]|uniref:hypothetical protein n=1 Tax=Brevundimonas sp. LF-1 TaxID=3126100 RepID=UPI0030E210E1